MTIHFHELESTRHLQPAFHEGDGLHLVRAKGRAALLEVPAGWCSVWMPLAGNLRVKSQETEWNLAPRDLLIWHEGGLRNGSQRPAWFLALCGPPGAWRPYLPTARDQTAGVKDIFPAHSRCPREVRRLFVQLARLAVRADATPGLVEHLASACCSAIAESQGEMREYLARCGGRTAKLLRLLRVHHLIDNNPHSRLDLLHLSRIANYSPWHLTRAYRDVFGETPSEHAIRLRLKHAMELVSGSTLTVREITETLGFESQSTFCRSFKRAYGVTTTQARSCHSYQRCPSNPTDIVAWSS